MADEASPSKVLEPRNVSMTSSDTIDVPTGASAVPMTRTVSQTEQKDVPDQVPPLRA